MTVNNIRQSCVWPPPPLFTLPPCLLRVLRWTCVRDGGSRWSRTSSRRLTLGGGHLNRPGPALQHYSPPMNGAAKATKVVWDFHLKPTLHEMLLLLLILKAEIHLAPSNRICTNHLKWQVTAVSSSRTFTGLIWICLCVKVFWNFMFFICVRVF